MTTIDEEYIINLSIYTKNTQFKYYKTNFNNQIKQGAREIEKFKLKNFNLNVFHFTRN